MAFNRPWLRKQIASYLKDNSVSAELDTWIDLGAKRVSAVLECWEMEAEITASLVPYLETGIFDGGYSITQGDLIVDGGDAYSTSTSEKPASYITMTNDVKRILGVQYYNNGLWYNLQAMPKHEAAAFKRNGLPQVYLVEQRKIIPLPFLEGEFKAQVLKEVIIPSTDLEVDALTSYPYIFLNACLAEAADWKQDTEMAMKFEQKWVGDANKVKSTYLEERTGETPTMRAV